LICQEIFSEKEKKGKGKGVNGKNGNKPKETAKEIGKV